MTAIAVAKLHLRCPTAQRDRARFAIEDALRTELPDDGRLVLLRRMRIAAPGSSPHPGKRQAAMREAWATATGGARHGGEDGAMDANCVWFASRDEAECLLLARLLSGRATNAWFWRLALPEWRGARAEPWLAEMLAEALARQEDRRVLALVESCVAHGALAVLVEALITGAAAPVSVFSPPWMMPGVAAHAKAEANTAREYATAVAPRLAASVIAALPPMLRDLIVRLDRAGTGAKLATVAMLRAFVLRRSPALALDRLLLERTVTEALRQIGDPSPPRSRAGGDLRRSGETTRMEARSPRLRGDAGASEPDATPEAGTHLARPEATATGAVDQADELPDPLPSPAAFERLRSRHAGLWLVLPSLARMGFGTWLAERTDLLAAHPARQLLLAVARHHRVPWDDPTLAVLAPAPNEELPEWTPLWRHGLDRWLRCHARRRLHDLINRPGTLSWGDLRLDLRFPMADADIRLRLRALDRDPGWVEWLGLSVRYHFSEDRA